MLRTLAAFLAATLLSAAGAFAETPAAPQLTRIADGVYAYVGVPPGTPGNHFGANVGVVVGDDAVLVVDTLTSAREASQLVQNIRAVTDKPIRWVVNTHAHLDHALGNCVFADEGARIIAHKAGREALLATGEQTLQSGAAFGLAPDFWEGTRIVAPDVTFERELEVDLGHRIVRVLHSGFPSHTAGSSMVAVPDQGVLFTGDILFTDFHVYLGEGDFEGWAKTLDLIAAMPYKKLIPGHGPVSGAQDLADMKEYLKVFDANARALCETMTDPEQIKTEMLKRLPQRKDGAFIVDMNIATRYAKKGAGQAK